MINFIKSTGPYENILDAFINPIIENLDKSEYMKSYESKKDTGCYMHCPENTCQCRHSGKPQGNRLRIRHTGNRTPGRPVYAHRGAAGRKPADWERAAGCREIRRGTGTYVG